MRKVSSTTLVNDYIRNPALLIPLARQIQETKNILLRDGLTTLHNVASVAINNDKVSYVVSESLADALDTVDFSEVGNWGLDGKKVFNFIFKDGFLFDSKYQYKEMVMTILPPKTMLGYHSNSSEDEYKITLYLVGHPDEKGIMPGIYIGARYKKGSTMQDILNTALENLGNPIEDEIKLRVLRLSLNLILYMNSPSADIMRLKPQIYNQKVFREKFIGKPKNESELFNIYSLGWDFHGREYSVEMGTRKGHFRWQPCGKMWCDRKLVYISSTTVNYSSNKN
jgi:hypothetical protein